jgi:hypothetical protein
MEIEIEKPELIQAAMDANKAEMLDEVQKKIEIQQAYRLAELTKPEREQNRSSILAYEDNIRKFQDEKTEIEGATFAKWAGEVLASQCIQLEAARLQKKIDDDLQAARKAADQTLKELTENLIPKKGNWK